MILINIKWQLQRQPNTERHITHEANIMIASEGSSHLELGFMVSVS